MTIYFIGDAKRRYKWRIYFFKFTSFFQLEKIKESTAGDLFHRTIQNKVRG